LGVRDVIRKRRGFVQIFGAFPKDSTLQKKLVNRGRVCNFGLGG